MGRHAVWLIGELRQGISLHSFVPSSSRHLDAIERHDLPERRFATLPALLDAVGAALAAHEDARIAKQHDRPRPTA